MSPTPTILAADVMPTQPLVGGADLAGVLGAMSCAVGGALAAFGLGRVPAVSPRSVAAPRLAARRPAARWAVASAVLLAGAPAPTAGTQMLSTTANETPARHRG